MKKLKKYITYFLQNEIAYLSATEYGLTVDDWEIDEAFFLKLGFYNNFELETAEDAEAFKEKKIQFLNQFQMNEEKEFLKGPDSSW